MAYILYDGSGALKCHTDVREDWNGHAFHKVRQVGMTSLQIFQFTAANSHTTNQSKYISNTP